MEAPIGRGADRKRARLDVVSNESVGTREVAFTSGAGDLACGCVNTQLLILTSVGLVTVWTIRTIGKNEVSEGLKIQFSFPYGTEDTVPVCLI